MYRVAKAFVILGVVLLSVSSLCVAQEPASSPSPSPATDENVKAASDEPTRPPSTTPDNVSQRETMTGNWGGARSRWKEKGVELEFKLSQFYQGISSGGSRHESEYTGKFETTWKFDLSKIAGWKFWSAEIKAESRFGGSGLLPTGGVNPTNSATITPGANGSVTSVTALNFTKLIPKNLQKGELYAVTFGRFNILDLLQEDFFAGAGVDRFFNLAQVGPLIVIREVPLITNGISFAYLKGGEPFVTLAVIDPNDHSVDPGIKDLLGDGVTFMPGINFATKYGGKSGKHSIGGAVTTKKYTPFSAIKDIIIPGPPGKPVEPQRGSWNISYVFRQYLVERGRKDGWGFFTQLAIANKETSPITTFVNVGLGGNGLFKQRRGDEFGLAYAYTDLSSVLKDNINLITLGNRRPLAEHQVEMFYNFHITPWLQLTGDLQIIRGVRRTVDRAVVPGGRLVVIF